MLYYYDILLNFGEENNFYKFYEWEENDSIEFIKKIPLFRIPNSTLKDLLKYQVKFPTSLVEQIHCKTILKSNSKYLENAFIVSDAKNALALELDNDGYVISRSNLLLSDEINLTEMMYTIKETKIQYEKLKKYPIRKDIRQKEEIKKLIKCEITTLYKSNNISKLKYLYYEWFNENTSDIEIITSKMNKMLEKDSIENLNRIYNLIKYSYNKAS